MALFFDTAWFDEKLSERGLSRAVLAAVGGLSEEDLVLVFKDQRELSAGQVAAFAELLGVPASEVADRAGISTPSPMAQSPVEAKLTALERRVAALEVELARLKR
ncbi:MAG: DNA-binding protein [Pseudomonadota bacterium]|jgi:hypothetical protein